MIDSPGDWNTPPESLPAVLIRNGTEHKESVAKSQPEFTTTAVIEIEARVSGATASAAQDAIEALVYAVENAVFTNYSVVGMVQQVASVDSETDISSDGKVHFAGVKLTMRFEMFEVFDPTFTPPALTTWPVVPAAIVPLTNFTLDGDLVNIFDPSGTYVGSLFPLSITPAPRTQGPDGRMEGGINITLPQI